ncbi:unnamed protein product [Rotaria sordida]|uniref:Major facilitator superfamily (MFS) profile domain-containing protein n=1 Tax=Rotaria sordida TaxID=392033 RepID=A0A818VFM6_9BILA|nr:unnamed protein product [Rotaria sordida]
MLSDDSLEIPTKSLPNVESLSPSSQLLSSDKGRVKRRQHNESNTTDCSSIPPVIRHTTSWRWVIVFSSFCVHFVADGVLFSFGILMHVIKDDLNIELHTVGIIASLFLSLPLFLAPLASALVNKLGCRFVTMLGGLLCSIGLVLASFIGNFIGALIGIGIFCGTGLSCIYVPAVVIVAHYFDEHRAIATAIAVGGTGLGNAVVAQLIHVLNNYYDDWRDTTLFLSGVFFTIVGFGALFRPVEFSFRRKSKNYHRKSNDSHLPSILMASTEKLQLFINEMDKQCISNKSNQTVDISISNHETKKLGLFDSYSADDIKKLEDDFNDSIHVTTCREKIPITKVHFSLKSQTKNDKTIEEIDSVRCFSPHFLSRTSEEQLLEVYYQPISQKDIFYPGNVPLKRSNLSRKSCPNLLQSYVYEESFTSIIDDNSNSVRGRHRRLVFYHKGLSFFRTLRRMLGLELFHDYRYVIFFISQFLFYLFYDLIYLFPVDYGETFVGYSKKQMTMLVTVLGFGQFFGQLLFGFLATYARINELILYDIGAVLCGLASLLIPYVVYSYIALIMAILLFGLSISANYALTSIILANMCGLESLTSAYGLILLGQGISSLSGPVIGGWIAEKYGYKSSLIIAGIFMGISGFVTLLIPLIQRLYKNEKEKDTNTEETIKINTITMPLDDFN